MLKYCKVINDETKEVSIGLGDNEDFYKSIGFEEQEVIEVNHRYYLKGYEPKPTIEEIKQDMLKTLKQNIDNYFYGNYPQYKQNNIAIFGIEEEKQKFKDFHTKTVDIYDNVIKQIEEAETEEELNNIDINRDIFNDNANV